MNLLVRNARIIDPNSPHNGQLLDIHIENGILKTIQADLTVENTAVFDAKGACVSPGWIDVGVQAGDPGFAIGGAGSRFWRIYRNCRTAQYRPGATLQIGNFIH